MRATQQAFDTSVAQTQRALAEARFAVGAAELDLAKTRIAAENAVKDASNRIAVERTISAAQTAAVTCVVPTSIAIVATQTALARPTATVPATPAPIPTALPVASELQIGTTPGNIVAGQIITPSFKVSLLDASGRIALLDGVPVTLKLKPVNAATQAAVERTQLLGTTTVNTVRGIAEFSDLSIRVAGTYRIVAEAPGLSPKESAPFAVTPADSANVLIQVFPAGSNEPLTGFLPRVVGTRFDVEVSLRDRFNNPIEKTDTITMSIINNRNESVPFTHQNTGDQRELSLPYTSGGVRFQGLILTQSSNREEYRIAARARDANIIAYTERFIVETLNVRINIEYARLDSLFVGNRPPDNLQYTVSPEERYHPKPEANTVCKNFTTQYQPDLNRGSIARTGAHTVTVTANEPCEGRGERTFIVGDAPTALTVTNVTTDSITLQWQDNSDNETHFEIERCQVSDCSNSTSGTAVPANTTTYTDTNLPSGSYRYRVRAVNDSFQSSYSDPVTVTIPP